MDKTAGWMALLYVLAGMIWVTLSGSLSGDPFQQPTFWRKHTSEFAWVLISGGLIYGGVRFYRRRLRANVLQYQHFFRDNPQPMLILEAATGKILAVNQAAVQSNGHPEAEFQKLHITDLEERAPSRRAINPPKVQPSSAGSGIHYHLNSQGQRFAVKVSLHDIDYRGTSAHLNQVAEMDDLIRTDLEGRFTYVNPRFKEKFGFKHDHLIGLDSLETVAPVDHEACQEMAATCLSQSDKIVPLQLRKPRPEGGYYYTDWEFVGIQNEQGEVFEVQGIGQDATDRIQNEQQILLQNQRLREVAWISSHELRRPVANMLGLVEIIAAEQVVSDALMNPLQTSVRELDQIIHDIVQKTYEAEENMQSPEGLA
jgi:PAS domain S-box-containing protein